MENKLLLQLRTQQQQQQEQMQRLERLIHTQAAALSTQLEGNTGARKVLQGRVDGQAVRK